MTFRYAHSANYSFYHQMSSKLTKHNRIKQIGHQIHRKHYITPNNLSLDLADWWNRNNHKKDTSSRGVTTFFAKSVLPFSSVRVIWMTEQIPDLSFYRSHIVLACMQIALLLYISTVFCQNCHFLLGQISQIIWGSITVNFLSFLVFCQFNWNLWEKTAIYIAVTIYSKKYNAHVMKA